MARSHVDLTGYPHTACIHLIACSMDGRSYTLLASWSAFLAFFDGHCGCLCPLCCTSGIWYCPCSLRLQMRIGSPLHVIVLFPPCVPSLHPLWKSRLFHHLLFVQHSLMNLGNLGMCLPCVLHLKVDYHFLGVMLHKETCILEFICCIWHRWKVDYGLDVNVKCQRRYAILGLFFITACHLLCSSYCCPSYHPA